MDGRHYGMGGGYVVKVFLGSGGSGVGVYGMDGLWGGRGVTGWGMMAWVVMGWGIMGWRGV